MIGWKTTRAYWNLLIIFPALFQSGHGEVTLSDGDFQEDDWSISTRLGPNTEPIIVSATRQETGGNPEAYRRIQHTVTATGAGFAFGWIWHLNTSQTYDPANGAISAINHSSRHRREGSSSGQGTSTTMVIEQDGKIYFSTTGQITISTKWVSFELENLTASDFGLLRADGSGLDTNERPDFSPSGSPMKFGIGFSNTPNNSSFAITHGIDEWEVTIEQSPVVNISRGSNPDTLLIEWNCGVLFRANSLEGPWVEVVGATSPNSFPVSGNERMFWRASNP